jgi:transposase
MGRFDLSDEAFAKIAPLLPSQVGKVGRKRADDHRVLNGILWVLRTGAPWRDLPERYGKWKTVNSRFYRWSDSGLWQSILKRLQAEAADSDDLDWVVQFVDGSVVRAHAQAAGAKKGAQTMKRSDTAAGASRPRSTSGPKGKAGRSTSS